ncbi:putative vacuolar protein sorting-associated protein 16 [Histomonas meleagridis]|uniref:putative vacuolar protein sorting-associated protein 16 n=1 Tax=Histomonas meleagridis TaxID=135588 RepID=UPI00355A4BF4|nr:putative vacuolar protein sorting-associated protein 16 [Histomonas meleagridis]KAH0806972.1 putative vacuolar protein sorting-associated protein 16 [Histomonas meleagridis]
MDLIWPPETRGWIEIGTNKYQKYSLYDFNEPEFENPSNVFLPGQNGGMLLLFKASNYGKVAVFSNSGSPLISTTNIQIHSPLAAFWCLNGYVGFLGYNGEVSIITLSGELYKVIEPPAPNITVLLQFSFLGGVAFYADNESFYVFDSAYYGFTPLSMGKLTTNDTNVSLIGYNNGNGYIVYGTEMYHVTESSSKLLGNLPFTPYFMYVSSNGQLVSVTDGKSLCTLSLDPSINFKVISTTEAITSVAFVDDSTVSFVSGGKLYFFQNGRDPQRISDQRVFFLVQDKNSIRVFQQTNPTRNELVVITQIHQSISTLFQKSISENLEKLYNAKLYFDNENIESYKLLEEIKSSLSTLIESILAAAPHILDVNVCERLFVLSSFAKYQVPSFDHNRFASTLQDIRVLNTLHLFKYGFTTLSTDFYNMDKNEFLSNLVQIQYYELANSFAKIYNLDQSIIAENWAQVMLKENRDREIDLILKKVSAYPNVDFLHLAKISKKYSLSDESIKKIVNRVRDPVDRMNFLLYELRSDKEAISDAIQSRDGNALIIYMYTKKMTMSYNLFGNLLGSYSQLADLYSVIKQQQERPKPMYEQILQIPDYPIMKGFFLELLYGSGRAFGSNSKKILNAIRMIDKNNVWNSILQTQMELLQLLQKLNLGDESKDINVPTHSARHWMSIAVAQNNESAFNKISKLYKANDRTQAWTKIKAFEQYQIWAGLEQMARRSQPLPWETFADECFSYGRQKEAMTFVDKMQNNENKVNLLIQNKCFDKAAAVAKSMKNEQLYNEVMYRANLS